MTRTVVRRPAWDDWDATLAEDEETRDTGDAHRALLRLARAQLPEDFEYAVGGASMRIDTRRGYYVEVRGQSSVTGHGKQGARPERLAALRDLDAPVLLVFVEHGAGMLRWGWLDLLPPAEWIARDPVNKRQGWHVGQLNTVSTAAFRFPDGPPDTDPSAAGRLI